MTSPFTSRPETTHSPSRSIHRKLRAVIASATVFAVACGAAAEAATVIIQPSKDNSIYSESDTSNGLGRLYAGETFSGSLRRALLGFDIAASGIPAGSIIDSVSLSLVQTKIGPAGAALFEIHPLTAAWGEGTSSGTGSGGLATPGDATWNFRLFDTAAWTTPGGDFGPTSGTATFGTALATYTFASTPGLVGDVQNWLNTPASNFGWILKAANEAPGVTSARELGSGESILAEQPKLTINYTVVPEPGTAALIGVAAIAASARRRRKA